MAVTQITRETLDNEAQELRKEYQRIIQSTQFNGVRLLDGTLGNGSRVQLGYGIDGSINAGVGGAIGTGTFVNSETIAQPSFTMAFAVGDIDGDGIQDMVSGDNLYGRISIMTGKGDGTFSLNESALTLHDVIGLNLADLDGDGTLDIIAGSTWDGALYVSFNQGDGTFVRKCL